MQGVILNILFIFLSVEFVRLRDQFGGLEIGTKRIGQWILLLERLIMVEEFLKQKSFVKKDVKLFKKWFPNLLHLFKHVVDRQASTKLKLLKFHLCTHFAGDILKWGLPSAYNSSTGESNHKMLKRRSKKTQKRLEFFEEQTGVRYVEQLALKRSIDHSINLGFQHHSISSVGLEHPDVSYRGYSFFLNRNGIFETSNAKGKKTASWCNQALQDEIYELVTGQILPFVDDDKIALITIAKIDGVIYRGNPAYKKSYWQDWAYYDWGEEYGLVPVQILVYLDLSALRIELQVSGVNVPPGGVVAVVHMVEKSLDSTYTDNTGRACNFRAHAKSKLFFKAKKMLDQRSNRPLLSLVSASNIASPCIAVKSDLGDINDNESYLFLKSRDEWPSILNEVMKTSMRVGEIV
jgi:hypothetical protein